MCRRSDLREIPLDEALDTSMPKSIVTMGEKQWDTMLKGCYESGWVLVEVDGNETPIRAFQKEAN